MRVCEENNRKKLQRHQCELGVEFEWMIFFSFMYLFCILSLSLIIWTSSMDVSNLSNHVKYCVGILSF